MGYFGIVSPAYTGHLNPLGVLSRALMRRGNRVAMVAPLDAEEKIRSAGIEFIPVGQVELPKGEWDRRTALQGELTGFAASRFVGKWMGDCARGYIRDLPHIFEREKFDGVVMDQICLGTEAVCEVMNIPLTVACSALALNWEPDVPPPNSHRRYAPSFLNRLKNTLTYAAFSATGLPVGRAVGLYRFKNRLPQMRFTHMNYLKPSVLQIAQQPEMFDFPRKKLPPFFHYTAPWKEPAVEAKGFFPWERLDGRPLIYASMGTLQNRLDYVFRIIAEACASLDAQLVIALGYKGATMADLPGNPIVVDYAPQIALLQRAAIVITHGGMNSTLETLMSGLPMVLVPITNDQPGVATRVEYLGAGKRVLLPELSADRLRAAVQDVFTNPSYREAAQHCAAEMKKVDGPQRAAELIEIAFKTKRPLLRT